MSCGKYIVQNVITAKPEEKVSVVLERIQRNGIRVVPVLEDSGNFLGLFSVHTLLGAVLPKSVTMDHGLDNVDFAVNSSPMIAEKLTAVMNSPISGLIDGNSVTVDEQTHTLEGMRLLYREKGPIVVIEKSTGKFFGLLTEQSMISILQSTSK